MSRFAQPCTAEAEGHTQRHAQRARGNAQSRRCCRADGAHAAGTLRPCAYTKQSAGARQAGTAHNLCRTRNPSRCVCIVTTTTTRLRLKHDPSPRVQNTRSVTTTTTTITTTAATHLRLKHADEALDEVLDLVPHRVVHLRREIKRHHSSGAQVKKAEGHRTGLRGKTWLFYEHACVRAPLSK